MGSRAVAVLCRSAEVARRRFGVEDDGRGIIYTRTGRRFLNDPALEQTILETLDEGLERAGLWSELDTDWVCLDTELMPWSAKAMDLVRGQYAAVGAAGVAMLQSLAKLASGVPAIAEVASERLEALRAYREAYAPYCWDVRGLADIRIAPFHLLASEGKTYIDRDHAWHMGTLARFAAELPELVVATSHRIVDLADTASRDDAIAWWTELVSKGGEGMVVKPLEFVARGKRGILQPAIKCRGPEYLRIIYGPEYTREANLVRLKERGLSAKRSLALREFALGVEGLSRFVSKEPLRAVHECVFGVLALESDPVDPRL